MDGTDVFPLYGGIATTEGEEEREGRDGRAGSTDASRGL